MPKMKAGERKRDEARGKGGPKYNGTNWKAADARKSDERYGHTRSDDAELAPSGMRDDGDPREASFPSTVNLEHGGDGIGLGRAKKSGARGKAANGKLRGKRPR